MNNYTHKFEGYKHPTKEKKVVLHIPSKLYALVDEIVFQEKTTLKQFIISAVALADKIQVDENTGDQLRAFIAKMGAGIKHTSVYIPEDEYESIRAIKHYNKTTQSVVFLASIVAWLSERYAESYYDLDGMADLVEAKKSLINNE